MGTSLSCLPSLLAQSAGGGWIGTWSPGIGDPNFVGWFTVVAYALAGFLCLRVYRQLPGPKPRGILGLARALAPLPLAFVAGSQWISRLSRDVRLRALWLAFTVVLFFLCINKQLDLQTALTEIGRIMARSEGWAGVHRQVQVVFIACVMLGGAWSFRTVWLMARGSARQTRSVLMGFVFLICFVTIRATSFHHVDHLLGMNFAGFRPNWIFELGGIAFVIHGAWFTLRASRAGPPRRNASERRPRPPRS